MTTKVLITGANKGIGRATVAAVLEARDDALVLLGSRDEGRGQAAREALVARDATWADRIEVVPIDVSDEGSVRGAAEAVKSRHGQLYGVVNNAGIGLGGEDLQTILGVNTYGPKRVCDAFLPMLTDRVVNVSSASGPMFVASCREDRQAQLTDPDMTWERVEAFIADAHAVKGDFAGAGMGSGNLYGLSKACLNAYTVALARKHPELTINACTPGYIATDLTVPRAERSGVDPASMGMKPPEEGTRASLHLLFGEPGGSGWYFGSDAQRSPLDRYRSPGDPPFRGD